MTSVLVILAVLILLSVLFLIRRVNQIGNSILSAMMDRYASIINHYTSLENTITRQVNTITTVVSSQQEEVVQLTNKVDKCLTDCSTQTRHLGEKFNNLETRITAPIDKINDTHNRIKTLGKSAASTDDLRALLTEVVSAVATEAVNSVCQKCAPKPKTTKKVTKEPVTEVKS